MPDICIMKLLKSLYDLKQAAYDFKDHLDKTLSALRFKRLCCDSSVYLASHKGSKISLTSHVDDIVFLSSNIEDIEEIFSKLSNTYPMIFQATAIEYLGYIITRNKEEKTISLSQKGRILKLLDLFPQKAFFKASCFPFLRTAVINEDLLSEADKNVYEQITG